MPDIEANQRQWDRDYAWPEAGDEWSLPWSGPDAQWHFTLWPRLRRFLPAGTILEIAPGHGRWTRYLVECCDRYIGVDLSGHGIAACRRRFADVGHAEFHVNDGRSLSAAGDASVDFAFSFDSLVHVEQDVVADYVRELARVLAPDGVAFLHHSNLAACRPVARPLRVALRVAERARRVDTGGFDQWRGTTMSAQRLAELAAQAGLTCIGQEIVNWNGGRLIDCLSLLTPARSRWNRPNRVVDNPWFMTEAASSARAAHVYCNSIAPAASFPAASVAQPLGALSKVACRSVGPWTISLVGPWPGRRRA